MEKRTYNLQTPPPLSSIDVMANISDSEWQQLLNDLSNPDDLQDDFSFDFGGSELDPYQVEGLHSITANPEETTGNPADTLFSWSENGQVTEPKGFCQAEDKSTCELRQFVERLQQE